MSLTRVEPTAINSNATFVFANATVNTNLVTSNLSANIINANTINYNGIANLGNVGNVRIFGGNANNALLTDGNGNLSWGVTNANIANTVSSNAQPNITSVGNLSSITVSNSSAGAVSPVNIQETWNNAGISFTGVSLNVTDSNSAVSSNLINLSVGNVSRFAVNKTGSVTANNANLGNVASANFLSGTLTTSFQPNITSIGQLSVLGVSSNITAGNAILSGSIYGAVQGVIGGLTPNSATFTAVNINNTASISGNLSSGNANLGNTARANFFVGDGGLLSNIAVGAASNANTANFANFANFAGTVTSANQPNITSLGNLSSLRVDSNITADAVRGTIVSTGLLNVNTSATITTLAVSGDTQLTSLVAKSSMEYMIPLINAIGSVTYNYLDGTVYYHVMSGNVDVNFTNVPSNSTAAIVFVLTIYQGSVPYKFSSVSVNGTAQTIKWLGGAAPTNVADKIEVHSFTLFRVNNSWLVLGQMNSYGP